MASDFLKYDDTKQMWFLDITTIAQELGVPIDLVYHTAQILHQGLADSEPYIIFTPDGELDRIYIDPNCKYVDTLLNTIIRILECLKILTKELYNKIECFRKQILDEYSNILRKKYDTIG